MLHRSPLSSVDTVVSKLLAKEIRLKSQAEKGIHLVPSSSLLALPSKPRFNNQSKPRVLHVLDECSYCKKKGHWKTQCPKLRAPQPQHLAATTTTLSIETTVL